MPNSRPGRKEAAREEVADDDDVSYDDESASGGEASQILGGFYDLMYE